MMPGIDWLPSQVLELPLASPPLLVLVGEEKTLTWALAEIQAATQTPHIALSQELGRHLLEMTPRERIRVAAQTIRTLLRPYRNQTVLLDRTALLFLPELHLNPLQLLIDTSRTISPLVIAWNGQWDGTTLTYAIPDHPEYYRAVHPEALIVPISHEDICTTVT